MESVPLEYLVGKWWVMMQYPANSLYNLQNMPRYCGLETAMLLQGYDYEFHVV